MPFVGKITDSAGNTGLIGSTLYGTCATEAATVAKVVTLSDFDKLMNGVTIHVKFTYSNTATSPTLNVNSTGAKSIYKYGTTVPGTTALTSWPAGSIVSFTYDGTSWIMNDYHDDTNTDTKVTQAYSTTNNTYPVLLSSVAGISSTASRGDQTSIVNNQIYANPSNGRLYANIPEAFLFWGGKDFSGSYGPIDAAMIPTLSANRAAFYPGDRIVVEYTRDGGTTWLDYGADNTTKTALFTTSASFVVGKSTTSNIATPSCKLRITIKNTMGKLYSYIQKIAMFVSTGGSTGCTVDIKGRTRTNVEAESDTWANLKTAVPISGYSGWNILQTSFTTYGNSSSKSSQYDEIRFIFSITSHGSTAAGLSVSKIYMYGGVGWTTPSTLASTGLIYSYDASQNVVFPANITCGGTFIAKADVYTDALSSGALNMRNSDIYGCNSIKFADLCDSGAEGIQFYRDGTHADSFYGKSGKLYYHPNRAYGSTAGDVYTILHTGNLTITQSLTSGTKIGTITIDGTGTDLYAPSNTDTKVTQTAVGSTYTNYRPLVIGASNSATAGFSPSTVTDTTFTTQAIYCQPSSGAVYATTFNGNLTGNVTGQIDVTTTNPTSGTTYYGIFAAAQSGINYMRANDGFRVLSLQGTTSTYGYDYLLLGNDTASGITGNKYGGIRLYSSNTSYFQLTAGYQNEPTSFRFADSAGTTGADFSPETTNKYDFGTSSLKWRNVHATTLNGELKGTISTATTATTQDVTNTSTRVATTAHVTNKLYLAGVYYNSQSGFASAPWGKVWEYNINAESAHRHISFILEQGYQGTNAPNTLGILMVHIATNASKEYDGGHVFWLSASDGLNKDDVAVTYQGSGNCIVQIWIKTTQRYQSFHLHPLYSGVLGSASAIMGTYSSPTSGVANYEGTLITSSYTTLKNPATKLGTSNVGDKGIPIYLSSGTPTACSTPASGTWWSTSNALVPQISTAGILEIGKYIDLHATAASTNNFDYRFEAVGEKEIMLSSAHTDNVLTLNSDGYNQIRFKTTATDKSYTASGIISYPLSTSGQTMLLQCGGNMVIGGGEFATSAYKRYNANNTSQTGYDNIVTSENEKLYLGADKGVEIITNAQDIETYNNNDHKVWAFGIDGGLTTPGSITLAASSNINMGTSGNINLADGGSLIKPKITSGNSIALIQDTRPESNYVTAIKWTFDGADLGTYGASIGFHNTGGDSTNQGAIIIIPYGTSTTPWSKNAGLYIGKGILKLDGTDVSLSTHTHNYAASATAGGTAKASESLKLTHGNEINVSKMTYHHCWFGYRFNTDGTEETGDSTYYINEWRFGNCKGGYYARIYAAGYCTRNINIQTGSTKAQKITLQTLMTWLINQGYITNTTQSARVLISPPWTFADNDILQLTINGVNYEMFLAGSQIEFTGYATAYNIGAYKLKITSPPFNSTSYAVSTGYYRFPVNSTAIYHCNGAANNQYNPAWTSPDIGNNHDGFYVYRKMSPVRATSTDGYNGQFLLYNSTGTAGTNETLISITDLFANWSVVEIHVQFVYGTNLGGATCILPLDFIKANGTSYAFTTVSVSSGASNQVGALSFRRGSNDSQLYMNSSASNVQNIKVIGLY